MKLKRIGVDLAKNVFQIHGVDSHEKSVWRQQLSRERWLQTVLEKSSQAVKSGWKVVVVCIIGRGSFGRAAMW
jgi:transposase